MKTSEGGGKGKQMVERTTTKHRPLVSVAVRFVVFTRVGNQRYCHLLLYLIPDYSMTSGPGNDDERQSLLNTRSGSHYDSTKIVVVASGIDGAAIHRNEGDCE